MLCQTVLYLPHRASTIQSEDGTKHIRLYLKDGCMEVLSFVSSEGQFLDHQSVIRCGFVYSRMLWSKLITTCVNLRDSQ